MGAGSFGQDADTFGAFGTAAGSSGFGLSVPTGVFGDSGSGFGVNGVSNSSAGVRGDSDSGPGVVGTSRAEAGVRGFSTLGAGINGQAGVTGLAGRFDGDVAVIGNLTVSQGTLSATSVTSSVKQFKIDHPIDPANKYLVHTSVESSEMINIYNGNVVLDASGAAVVELPAWFEALNHDFRYQLTPIGAPGPDLYVAEKIRECSFRIAGGKPGSEVSWQVTGVRQDAYARAHCVRVEQEKAERGFYLHPELFGQPPEKGVEWARRPELMRRMKDEQEKTNRSVPCPEPVIPDAVQKAGSMLESAPSGE